jgi:hypothetical protein
MAKDEKTIKVVHKGPFAGFYLLTYIGTLIHFLNTANGAGEVLLAFLQALVWPAFLINKVFTVLQI